MRSLAGEAISQVPQGQDKEEMWDQPSMQAHTHLTLLEFCSDFIKGTQGLASPDTITEVHHVCFFRWPAIQFTFSVSITTTPSPKWEPTSLTRLEAMVFMQTSRASHLPADMPMPFLKDLYKKHPPPPIFARSPLASDETSQFLSHILCVWLDHR